MSDQANSIICLNYCMPDLATGYCLTCGRPPLPVTGLDLNQKTFAGISLKAMTITPLPNTTEDEALQ
jgi:hypothetical protein